MRYAEIKFGRSKGTQVAVIFGETPRNYKGFRWNASAGSLQLQFLHYPKNADGGHDRDPRTNCWVSEYRYRSPAPIPKDAVIRWIDEPEFLSQAVARTVRQLWSGSKTTPSDVHRNALAELDEVREQYSKYFEVK